MVMDAALVYSFSQLYALHCMILPQCIHGIVITIWMFLLLSYWEQTFYEQFFFPVCLGAHLWELLYIPGIRIPPQENMKVKVAQSCPTVCDPVDYIVHGILQARILEWVAFPFSRGSSQPRSPTLQEYSLPAWATREDHRKIWMYSNLLDHTKFPEWFASTYNHVWWRVLVVLPFLILITCCCCCW